MLWLFPQRTGGGLGLGRVVAVGGRGLARCRPLGILWVPVDSISCRILWVQVDSISCRIPWVPVDSISCRILWVRPDSTGWVPVGSTTRCN
jgi:hypothetical protein